MKRFFTILLCVMLTLAVGSAFAQEAYPTKTEVWACDESPTGYYVTFRY